MNMFHANIGDIDTRKKKFWFAIDFGKKKQETKSDLV